MSKQHPRRNLAVLPALVPDFSKPIPSSKDSINEALAVTVLELKRELTGRDKRITGLEATIRELRRAAIFKEYVKPLLPAPAEAR